MKQKKIIIRIIFTLTIMVSIMSTIPVNSIAKTKSNSTLYKNPVFTKKLYQQTKNIGFGSDGSILAKDKKTVKQIYKLLATMKLQIQKHPSDEPKMGFTSLVIHTKNGKMKTFLFSGDELSIGTKVYTITQNNPLEKLHEIYGHIAS